MLTPPMKRLLAVTASLSLAACDQSGEVDAPREDPQANGATTGGPLRVGLYRVVQSGDVEIEEERCIDSATVAAGRFVLPSQMGTGWNIEANRMSGGKIVVAAQHPSGSRLTIDGSYGTDSFQTEGTFEMKLNGEAHVIRTAQHGQFASAVCPDGEA